MDDQQLITQNADPSLAQIVEKVEENLVIRILESIEDDQMSMEEAQKTAKEFLALLPIADKQELLNKLNNLAEENKEAKYVYNDYVATLDEETRQKTLDTMREHIQNGNIDQAIQVAKQTYGRE